MALQNLTHFQILTHVPRFQPNMRIWTLKSASTLICQKWEFSAGFVGSSGISNNLTFLDWKKRSL